MAGGQYSNKSAHKDFKMDHAILKNIFFDFLCISRCYFYLSNYLSIKFKFKYWGLHARIKVLLIK